MLHALLLAVGFLAAAAYGLALWAALRSWHRATGLRAHLARWLAHDQGLAGRSGWWAALVRWGQVAAAIVVMPIAALALVAAVLALSLGMVLLTLTIAAVCGCAILIARVAAQRTSAPGL